MPKWDLISIEDLTRADVGLILDTPESFRCGPAGIGQAAAEATLSVWTVPGKLGIARGRKSDV